VPPLIAGLLYLPSAIVLGVLILISILSMFEFYHLLDRAQIPSFRFVGAFCGIGVLLATYFGFRWNPGETAAASLARSDEWEMLALVFTVLVILVRQFPQAHNDKPLPTMACTLLGVLYVPFLLSFFVKLGLFASNVSWHTSLHGQPGIFFIFYVVLVAKLTDAGAFFVGMALGRHKLFPRLSPSKTWEGFAGGVATGVAVSMLFFRFADGHLGAIAVSPYHAVILGAILSLTAMAGDLVESLFKRASSAKDSGTLIPGIGGMLDTADSFIFAVPVFYLYLRVVLC